MREAYLSSCIIDCITLKMLNLYTCIVPLRDFKAFKPASTKVHGPPVSVLH